MLIRPQGPRSLLTKSVVVSYKFENYGSGVGNAGLLVLVALSCALLALPLFVTDDALSLQSTECKWQMKSSMYQQG
ncbi:hypothetical protein NC652_000363 [Populus alba x Populus x berolinensis]|nr:hypothetical protein NC652_000363 [Populus alba x Populus x berolinensis]